MQRKRKLTIIVAVVVIAVVALFAVVGALSSHLAGGGSSGASVAGTQAGTRFGASIASNGKAAEIAGPTSDSAAAGTTTAVATELPSASAPSSHYLVRNGELSLLVGRGDLAAVVAHVTSITTGMGGYVVSSAIGDTSGLPLPAKPAATSGQPIPSAGTKNGTTSTSLGAGYATLTVRVPERSFDAAVRRFSALGDVQSVSTTSEDVTSQYVDLQARLSHYRAVERRLVRFLAATKTINEMLAVQDRIDKTQLTIERLSAELKSLRETTSYGTLAIFLRERGTHPVATAGTTFGGTFWHSLRILGRGARLTGLAIVALLPFAVVFGGIGLLVWWVRRRLRRRRQPAPPTLPA